MGRRVGLAASFLRKTQTPKLGEMAQIDRMDFGEMPEFRKVGNVRDIAQPRYF